MSSNKDIRLSVGFPNHPKTLKLKRRLGSRGILSFIYLLLFAAQNKPNGKLINMSHEDIAIAAGWNSKDSKLFVNTLVEIKFLDLRDGVFHIHDWEEHNAWAFHATERSEHARKAASARWTKRNYAPSINEHCLEHSSAMQDAQNRNAPSPSPSPSPKHDECLSMLRHIPGYPFDEDKDRAFLMEKEREFPTVDVLYLLRGWKAFLVDRPLNGKSKARAQLHNQFELSMKFNRNQKQPLKPQSPGDDTLAKIKKAKKEQK